MAALLVEAQRLHFSEIYCATATAVSLLEREGWTRIDAVSHDGGTQFIFRAAAGNACRLEKRRLGGARRGRASYSMSGRFAILEDDPGRPGVACLLARHLATMARHSPPESVHALDVQSLREP